MMMPSSSVPLPTRRELAPQQQQQSTAAASTIPLHATTTTTTTSSSVAAPSHHHMLPGRMNSMPTFGAGAAASTRDAPTVNGWCNVQPAANNNKASPREVPLAPTTHSAAAAAASEAVPMQPSKKAAVEDEEERHHLTALHDHLHQTLMLADAAATTTGGPTGPEPPVLMSGCVAPTVWVTDYADFSQKYGLTYKLSSGHTGVHFNDSTKMAWEPITSRVEYYARIKETINGVVHAQDSRSSFHMDTFPDTLNKKVTLIKYFKSYLSKAKGKKDGIEVVACSPYHSTAPVLLTEPHMVSDMIYVKRWLLTKQAMIFRLSNRTIQVCFFDQTEVILSSETKVVTFTEANGRRRTIPLAAVATQNDQVATRLKYTKDILCKLINNKEL
jgi:polo-like kinase 1